MRIRNLVVAAAAVVAFSASSALAGTVTVIAAENQASTGLPTQGVGGEFAVFAFSGEFSTPAAGVTSADAGSLFNTFCLERNESLAGTTNYQLSDEAKAGGLGGQDTATGDTLSVDSAKLFYAFWADAWTDITVNASTLSVDYDYEDNVSRLDDAKAFQLALWFLEDELGGVTLSDYDPSGKAQDFIDFANNVTWAELGKADWDNIRGGLGNVWVMNNTDATGAFKQDTLVVVPLPPAGLLGLALLGGLGLMHVRRRKRQIA